MVMMMMIGAGSVRLDKSEHNRSPNHSVEHTWAKACGCGCLNGSSGTNPIPDIKLRYFLFDSSVFNIIYSYDYFVSHDPEEQKKGF